MCAAQGLRCAYIWLRCGGRADAVADLSTPFLLGFLLRFFVLVAGAFLSSISCISTWCLQPVIRVSMLS